MVILIFITKMIIVLIFLFLNNPVSIPSLYKMFYFFIMMMTQLIISTMAIVTTLTLVIELETMIGMAEIDKKSEDIENKEIIINQQSHGQGTGEVHQRGLFNVDVGNYTVELRITK